MCFLFMSLSNFHIFTCVDSFQVVCAQTTPCGLCLPQTTHWPRQSWTSHEGCAQTLQGLRFTLKSRPHSVSGRGRPVHQDEFHWNVPNQGQGLLTWNSGMAKSGRAAGQLRHQARGGFLARNSPRALNLKEKWRRSWRKWRHFSLRGDDKITMRICRSTNPCLLITRRAAWYKWSGWSWVRMHSETSNYPICISRLFANNLSPGVGGAPSQKPISQEWHSRNCFWQWGELSE